MLGLISVSCYYCQQYYMGFFVGKIPVNACHKTWQKLTALLAILVAYHLQEKLFGIIIEILRFFQNQQNCEEGSKLNHTPKLHTY